LTNVTMLHHPRRISHR